MQNKEIDILEKRGKDLMENRTIKVSSDEVLLPEHVDSTLAPYPFKPVSELVDRVHTINLQGGETYTKSYVKSYLLIGFIPLIFKAVKLILNPMLNHTVKQEQL